MRAALALLLCSAAASAQQSRGFGEVRASLYPGAAGTKWQLLERVRPTLEAELHERVKLVATVEAALAQGRDLSEELERTLGGSELGPLLELAGCQWPAFRNAALRVSGSGDYLDVDRLYLDTYLGELDLRVGRQALNWGSAQFFNPTDPFPEVLLAEPWRPRRGVNAVRAHVPFGELRDFTAVVAVNDALDELRAAGRLRLNFSGTDLALLGAWRGRERGLVGLDLRGTFGVGWWVEAAYLFGAPAHEELAVGIDYSIPLLERATAFAQYYRNGAGSAEPGFTGRSGGLSAAVAPTCARGESPLGGAAERDPFAPFTFGRDYLVVGAMLGILPELSASLAGLQNLNDGSGVVVPTVSYNALDWLDLSLSAQVPFSWGAGGGEFDPRPEDMVIRVPAPGRPLTADLSGLVPDATITFWSRASF
ncbi:MAG: hypothetical protein HYZ28_13835 [Myxococcales bacterium]|nr:hypothetical protein [Myxococcales bacterium]